MNLVNKKNNASGGFVTSFMNARKRSSNSPRNFVPAMSEPRSSISTSFPFQNFRYVARGDPLGKPFHDSRFTHARLTDETWIVLGIGATEPASDAATPRRDRSPDRALLSSLYRLYSQHIFQALEFRFRRFVHHAG